MTNHSRFTRLLAAALGVTAACAVAFAQENRNGQRPDSRVASAARRGAKAAPAGVPVRPLIISELRARGAAGANDEFVEIYNYSSSPFVVSAPDGSAGFAVAASDGVVRFVIPNGTAIPGRGHYLGVNSGGYSPAGYATANATYTDDIPDNAGVALFATATPANFTPATRLDAVGANTEANALYREGAGYAPVNTVDTQYSLLRDLSAGQPKDTDDNQADFRVVGPTVVVRNDATLGYPGPENLSSPVPRNAQLKASLVDPSQPSSAPPNRVRDAGTGTPCSSFGTLSIRRTFTNTTGVPVTRLRFRAVDITTAPAPFGVADLRPITSGNVSVTVGGVPRTVQGTTLETAGGVFGNNCGGLNATLSADGVSAATPLAPGASVTVQLLLGVQQSGTFRFLINVEALP